MKRKTIHTKTAHGSALSPLQSWLRTICITTGVILLSLALMAPSARAQVTLTLGDAVGMVGETALMPVELTGLTDDVWSFELKVTWSPTFAVCTGVVTSGTLSEDWIVDFSPAYGIVTISGANAAPLLGDGTLLYVEFELGPHGNRTVYLDEAVFNEGSPTVERVNGRLVISNWPTINITPDTGLLVVGDSLSFSTNGGTPPYTYTSSDPLVADFSGDQWLHMLSPGQVQVTTEDATGITNTTEDVIEVRAFTLEVMDLAATEGDTVLVPVEIGDPAVYGISSGEFDVWWTANNMQFVGVETAGTLMEAVGWGEPFFTYDDNEAFIAAAGANPLAGPGVFLYLRFVVTRGSTLYISPGMFNESYLALPESGFITVASLPVLRVSPSSADLLVGDLQEFEVTGDFTPPISWSVDDPTLASIDANGAFLALKEGIVQVQAEDSLGAVAINASVDICTLAIPSLVSEIHADETVLIPVKVDRPLGGLGIYSLELEVSYSSSHVEFLGAVTTGSATASWGTPFSSSENGLTRINQAGALPLVACPDALLYLEFRGLPGISTYSGVSLASLLINEGSPCVRINEGEACLGYPAGVLPGVGLQLLPNYPNPFNPRTTISFSSSIAGQVDLSIYSARGELLRTLYRGSVAADQVQSVDWDGRDNSERALASGVYYYRLKSGEGTLVRKMALLR